MEIVFGIAGLVAAVFVVIFGGRGLVDLVRGMSERRKPRASLSATQPIAPLPTQDVRFTTTSDGVSIAYWTLGEGEPLVVLPTLPTSHVQLEWRHDGIRNWYETLARSRTVVRFDHLGWPEVTDRFRDCSMSWAYFLESLRSLLEEGRGTPESVAPACEGSPAA